jgi:hypothetical protein
MNKSLNFVLSSIVAFAFCNSAFAEKKESGWTPLFNGKDFNGWYIISGQGKKNDDPKHLFQIHDGMVHMYKDAEDKSPQPNGYIITEKEYSNYHLRFEYKWGTKKFGGKVNAKRDAGLLYHVFGKDGVWPKSVECQIQEGDTGDIFTVNTRVTTTVDPMSTNRIANIVTNAAGVVRTNYSMQPFFKDASDGGVPIVQGVSDSIRRVHRNPENEKDGWNTVEVITRGDSSTYIINGKVNNKILHLENFVDGKWVPLTKGKILLQQEGAEVFYRNIEIKMLDK